VVLPCLARCLATRPSHPAEALTAKLTANRTDGRGRRWTALDGESRLDLRGSRPRRRERRPMRALVRPVATAHTSRAATPAAGRGQGGWVRLLLPQRSQAHGDRAGRPPVGRYPADPDGGGLV